MAPHCVPDVPSSPRLDMPSAVETSLLVIAINSAAALAGDRIASRIDASRLTTAFTVLLIAVAAYSLARSLPRLA